MGYIDYSYYTDTYKGSSIPESAFDRVANKAQAKVDYYTFNRIDKTESYMDKVKMCCCELAEQIYSHDSAKTGNGIASEKVYDYSVTYVGQKEIEQALNNNINTTINEWLAMTGLLYRGTY